MALAKAGARVLIVEREVQFRDRVRGEGMLPWGAAEARDLGIYQPLIDGCAHETRWWTAPDDNRDLVATTPSRLGCLNFYHPEMQQQLLGLAVAGGAELLRPAEVTGILPGDRPTVTLRADGRERQVTARLVVGADGRNSRVRRWAGFGSPARSRLHHHNRCSLSRHCAAGGCRAVRAEPGPAAAVDCLPDW